jgi:hypothetical protein
MTETGQELRETLPLEKTQEMDPPSVESSSNWKKFLLALGAAVILALIVIGLITLLQPGTDTGRIRDIFIIFMALEFLLIGIVMIILIIQLARLSLLLQNEISQILESTQETANTLRGTTEFMSEHLVEPVMKMNQYLAGMNRIIDFFRSDNK